MKMVIKIGGSLCFSEEGPNINYINKLVPVLRIVDKSNRTIVVIGGGRFVRNYIKNFSRFTKKLSNEKIEWIVIEMLKANVRLFAYLLNKKPIFDLSKLSMNSVIGGIKPGRSTDTNAAIAAAKTKSVLIKMTDVNGIYDKDPKKYKNAKLLKRIKFSELKAHRKTSPGNYGILDPTAIKIIKKYRVRTHIINGKNPNNLLKLLKGKNIGTMIC